MTKKIELTRGKVALVDDEDYERLNRYKWCANKRSNGFYAMRNSPRINGERTTIWMHRVILGLEFGDGAITDHINRDTLDNRRSNLRIVSSSGNQRNHSGRKHNKSGYNGVHWDKQNKRWRAQIGVNGKNVYLGQFTNIQDAVQARRRAELKYWGVTRTAMKNVLIGEAQ